MAHETMQSRQDDREPETKDLPMYHPYDPANPPRLGMDFQTRMPITMASAFVMGMVMGATHGSTMAAYKFRAENAHRFPSTSTGWYQYHKSKNYKSMIGGLKEGTKMGSKLGAGAMAFCFFEETMDHARNGEADFLSTVTAGLSLSGIYSFLAHHDMYTTARTVKLGLKMSLAYGLLQDAILTMKGNRPRYLGFIVNKNSDHTVSDGDSI